MGRKLAISKSGQDVPSESGDHVADARRTWDVRVDLASRRR